jgi:hypothetical protein
VIVVVAEGFTRFNASDRKAIDRVPFKVTGRRDVAAGTA